MKKKKPLTGEEAGYQKNGRKYLLKKKYGLTLANYNELFEKQKGCCAICGTHQWEITQALCVDHNHLTGEIRGLLCLGCNLGLGHFKESRGIFIKAIQYLGKHKK